MTSEKMYEVLGEIDEKYIKEAKETRKKKKMINYKVWGAIAACACLAIGGAAAFSNTSFHKKTELETIQIANPLQEVSSLEEMEKYVGFQVPALDKEVDAYIVIEDEDSKIARIEYADHSTFNMERGTGDISGIWGGTFQEEQEINQVKVSFYEYKGEEYTEKYALWEKDGFTYSYAGEKISAEEIEALIQ